MASIRRLLLLRNALWSATAPLSRQLFDVCATATIVIVAATMAARTMHVSVARTEVSEALSLTRGPMTEAALTYADRGRWPEPQVFDLAGIGRGRHVERIEIREGGDMRFSFMPEAHPLVRGRYGTVRPIVGDGGATIRWRLTDDDTGAGAAIDPQLMPYAWRLEPEEP